MAVGGTLNGFKWSVRVVANGRSRTSAVFVRKHRYEMGASVQFDPEYDRISVLEHVLGAVGADIVDGFQGIAKRRRVVIENVEAVVQGQLNNPLAHLRVVGEEGHAGIDRIDMNVYVSALADSSDLENMWEETLQNSMLVRTLSPTVQLNLQLKLVL